MRFLIFLSLAAVVGLAGCGSASRGGPIVRDAPWRALALAEDPYPAEIGCSWSYDTWQTQDQAPERPGRAQRFEIASHAPPGVVMRRFYGDWEAPPTLVRKDAGAVVLSRYHAGGPQATDSITVLRLPLQAGATWPGRTLAGATETISVVARETVAVPGGTFEAWHVRHDLRYAAGGGDTLDYWYGGGVGMIKAIERVTLQKDGKPYRLQVRAELAAYTAPGG